jgi:hypothetical protein
MAPKLLTLSSVSFNPALSFDVRFPNCKTEDMANYENQSGLRAFLCLDPQKTFSFKSNIACPIHRYLFRSLPLRIPQLSSRYIQEGCDRRNEKEMGLCLRSTILTINRHYISVPYSFTVLRNMVTKWLLDTADLRYIVWTHRGTLRIKLTFHDLLQCNALT